MKTTPLKLLLLACATAPRHIDFDSYTPRDNYARLTQLPTL